MTWIRNGSFPLIPSGLEITLFDEDQRKKITIKGEDSQMTERAAEAVLRALNVTPDLIAAMPGGGDLRELSAGPCVGPDGDDGNRNLASSAYLISGVT